MPQTPSREAEVLAVLESQVAAWNRGDIAGYMAGYWRSASTVFVSDGALTKGFDEVAGRYAARYRTREDMGTLAFEDLEVRIIAPTTAVAHGVWRLRRMSDEPWGRFTLIVEKKKEGWRIVHDHTSSGK
jgi:ketosteroid isomerase-like protein